MLKCTIKKIATSPASGQKPGTSGLRKPTKIFMQEHYTENFVQSTIQAVGEKLNGSTLVIGGDGRFYCTDACRKIIQMCAANGVSISYLYARTRVRIAMHLVLVRVSRALEP